VSGRRARAIRAALTVALGRVPHKAEFRGYRKDNGAAVFAPQDEARAARRAYTRGQRGFHLYRWHERPGAIARATGAVAGAFKKVLGRAA